jgi:hypothetical protein
VVSTTPRPLYPGKDPVPIVQEAGWAPGPFWTCAKNLATTEIRSPARPAHSQSPYRLSYPAHFYDVIDESYSCVCRVSGSQSSDGVLNPLLVHERFFSEYIDFLLSVTLHQYSILMLILLLVVL